MLAATPDLTRLKAAAIPVLHLKVIVIMMQKPAFMFENGIGATDLFARRMAVALGIRAQKLLCVPFDIDMCTGRQMDRETRA